MSLEDKILKRNIPGRYSSWKDNEDEYDDTGKNVENHNDDNDDDDDETDSIHGDSSKLYSSSHDILSQQSSYHSKKYYPSRSSYQTGVKGILADYKYEKQNQEYKHMMENQTPQTQQTTLVLSDTTTSASKALHSNIYPSHGTNTNHDEVNEDEVNDDDEDLEFLRNYREKRLLQLQEETTTNNCNNWPRFGQVQHVDPIQFAEIVDELDSRVFCIIHLYEKTLSTCQLLDTHLHTLAQRIPHCCFLRVQATMAKQDLDLIALPSVLIYRNRILVANLTPITASLDSTTSYTTIYPYNNARRRHGLLVQPLFTLEEIQKILESYGVCVCVCVENPIIL